MDERRDPPPDATPRTPLVGLGELSPVQRAYAAYTRHAIQCDTCRDVDRACHVAEALWRVYQEVSGAACRRIADAGK